MPLIAVTAVYRAGNAKLLQRGWARRMKIGVPWWCLDHCNNDKKALWVRRLYRCRLCSKLHADEHARLPQTAGGEPQVCDHCWTFRYRKILGGLKIENIRAGGAWWRHFYEQANLLATAKIFMREQKTYSSGFRWRAGAWRKPLSDESEQAADAESNKRRGSE